jgi:hypothetical protein
MKDVILTIFAVAMLVATAGHIIQVFRRERRLRDFHRQMAEAGRKKK